MTVNKRKQRRLARERNAIKEDNKKKARALHDERNALAHFEAQKKKTTFELHCDFKFKTANIVYFEGKEKQSIDDQFNYARNEFINFKQMLVENTPCKYLTKLEYNSFNNMICQITKKIVALEKLRERALYTQLVHGGLKINVWVDAFGVCVYIIVPEKHKTYKTCNAHFTGYTFDKVLEDGSKKFGWDFGVPNAMLMYKINRLFTNTNINRDKLYELYNEIYALRIITINDVNELIVEQLARILSFNTHICFNL